MEGGGVCLTMRREAALAIAGDSGVNNEILAHPSPFLLTCYESDEIALIFSYDVVPPCESHDTATRYSNKMGL